MYSYININWKDKTVKELKQFMIEEQQEINFTDEEAEERIVFI